MNNLNINPRFSLSLPDGWEDQTIYTFKGPDESGVQHNLILIIDKDPGTTDLTVYAKKKIESLQETLTGIELMGEQEMELAYGHVAYEVVYKWTPTDNKTLVQAQVYMIIDNIGYNFTASFTKKTIKTIGNEVSEIINSFNPISDEKKD